MKENDYIGKLVYEQFKKLEGKYDALEKRNAELSETLEKIKDMVIARMSKTKEEIYVGAFWNGNAIKLLDLLGIELEKEEEEDDTLSDQ